MKEHRGKEREEGRRAEIRHNRSIFTKGEGEFNRILVRPL